MKNSTKYAFFTMDLESFYDTSCIRKRKPIINKNNQGYDGVTNYLNILDESNIKATLFLVHTSLDDNYELLKKAIENGHKIAFHGTAHDSVLKINDDEYFNSIKESKKAIEDKLGITIYGNRMPMFKIDNKKYNIIKKIFKYDSSILNKNKVDELNQYELIDSNTYYKDDFYEIPPTTYKHKNIGGGAFVRLTPWIIMKNRIKKYLKHNNTYVFYIHPFELSKTKKDKIIGLNLLEKIFIKAKLKSYPKKLKWIINYLKKLNFSFTTIENYIKKD